MKIGSFDKQQQSPATVAQDPRKSTGATQAAQAAKAASASASAPAAASSSTVAISSTAAALSSVNGDGSFDAAKVERISRAIAEGSFKPDAGVIADKLITNAQELLGRAGR